MRSLSLTFCAALVAGTIALPASAAPADSKGDDSREEKRPGTVSVSPSRVSPGGEVELRTDACGKGRSARGSSEAFASEARFEPADGKGLVAQARIRSDAAPDTYEIQVTCKDGHGRSTGTVTVGRHSAPSPVAPVRAGGGGTAALAEDAAAGEGPGTRHAVLGLALGAVAAVAVAFRSARRRRPAQH
uniref:Sortase n=1 Tax=Streptomyces sp. NBC_01401 TaxID=2903854 RepID=A0AAU3GYK8_9ACTN